MDFYGRLWTAADSEPFCSGRYGPLRTAMDGVRPSTDQKVGDSSSSGRADKTPAVQGLRRVAVPAVFARTDLGSHSPSQNERLIAHQHFLVVNVHVCSPPSDGQNLSISERRCAVPEHSAKCALSLRLGDRCWPERE